MPDISSVPTLPGFLVDLLLAKFAGPIDYASKIEYGNHLVCKCGFDIEAADVPDSSVRAEALAQSLTRLLTELLADSHVRLRFCRPSQSVEWVNERCIAGSRFPVRCEFDNHFEQELESAGYRVLTGPPLPLTARCFFTEYLAQRHRHRFFAEIFLALTRLPTVAASLGLRLTPSQTATLEQLAAKHPWPAVHASWPDRAVAWLIPASAGPVPLRASARQK